MVVRSTSVGRGHAVSGPAHNDRPHHSHATRSAQHIMAPMLDLSSRAMWQWDCAVLAQACAAGHAMNAAVHILCDLWHTHEPVKGGLSPLTCPPI